MGADAVVEIEKTTVLGKRDGKDYVKIEVAPSEGQDIWPIGSDIRYLSEWIIPYRVPTAWPIR